jgi:hypothetical protein
MPSPILTLVQSGLLRGGVGKELALQARLQEVSALDRHRAAITFDEKRAVAAVGVLGWR